LEFGGTVIWRIY